MFFSSYFKWIIYTFNRHAQRIKDTHKEKAPLKKTSALTKTMNMDIWVVGTSNQPFIKGS